MDKDKKDYAEKSKKWADAIGNITIKLSLNDVLEDDSSQDLNKNNTEVAPESSDKISELSD